MPLRLGRKSRTMEKVENLYRTARVQNDSIGTPEKNQITLAQFSVRGSQGSQSARRMRIHRATSQPSITAFPVVRCARADRLSAERSARAVAPGYDLGAIRADRLIVTVDRTVGVCARPIAGLAKYEPFYRGIFRILRAPYRCPFEGSLKFRSFGPSFLRCSAPRFRVRRSQH